MVYGVYIYRVMRDYLYQSSHEEILRIPIESDCPSAVFVWKVDHEIQSHSHMLLCLMLSSHCGLTTYLSNHRYVRLSIDCPDL